MRTRLLMLMFLIHLFGSSTLLFASSKSGNISPLGTPVIVAAWTFDNLAAAPNTPRVINAEHGLQTTAAIYLDSTNGSSNWLQATELNSFAGTTLNDFRTPAISGGALSPIAGGTNNPANGKAMVFKFSMSGMENPMISFATRGTSTGFATHQWAYSTNGTTFVNFGPNTAVTATTFAVKTLNLDTINALDGAAVVYLRLTVSGATGTGSGNNRIDNFIIEASPLAAPPTKLEIVSFNSGKPITANVPFSVVVRAIDNSNFPQNVSTATGISLSLNTGIGNLSGTLSASIPLGANTFTFTGISCNTIQSGASIKVVRTSGDVLLPDSTPSFNVQKKFNPGEIAIIGVKSTNPDTFAFVNFTSIPAGTVLWFNDNELDSNRIFNTGEGEWTFTAPAAIPAGTVTGWNGAAGNGWSGTLALTSGGEQIFLYQYGAPHNYIFALNWGNAGWLSTPAALSGGDTYLPLTLTNGVNALHIGSSADYYYSKVVNTGTPSAILDSIVTSSKWTSGTTFPAWVFNLGPQPPVVATDSVSSVTFNSANVYARVISDGGSTVTSRGVCYSTTQNPTVAGNKVIVAGTTGSFNAGLSSLSSSQTYYVRAFAINSIDTTYGSQLSFTTLPPPVLAVLTTTAVSSIATTSAISGGNITSDGGATITARGVCWSTSANPTLANSFTVDGSGTGTFTSTVSPLSSNQTYFVRAYATNFAGTAYGNELSFTTAASAVAPTVSFDSVAAVIDTAAMLYARVVSDGGATVTSRGFLYGTAAVPGFSGPFVVTGSGTGNYNSAINGLTAGTTYNVRAFAINAVDTSYSTVSTFNTLVFTVPVLTTDSVKSIGITNATAYGKITSDGGKPVITRGFCYGVNPNPNLTDSVVIVSGSATNYNSVLSNLLSGTNYNVRAFATNSVGTGYGNNLTFATQPAGTNLMAGDIAFLAYATSTPDRFAFVLFTAVTANTQIVFTDNAWDGNATPPVLLSNENTCTWTAPSTGLPAGSVVRITGLTVVGGGTVVGQLNGLSSSGDQILAYQGTASAPVFIAGLSSTNWISTGTPTSNQSYLPIPLSLGGNTVGFNVHANNGYYNNVLSWATVPQLLAAINDSTNWIRSATNQTWPNYSFTLGAYVDTVPPVATHAIVVDSAHIKVRFNEKVSLASASNVSNYTGLGVISSATLNSTADTVTLVLQSALLSGVADTLLVSGIADTSSNVMTAIYSFPVFWVQAPTQVLKPGDIAFTAYRSDPDDAFRFVALVDIEPFVEIAFTDNAWNANVTPPVLNTNEFTLRWMAPASGLPKGSQVHIITPASGSPSVSGGGTLSGQNLGLSNMGDQILAYQGAATSPNFIAGLSSTGWISTGAPFTTTSYLPTGLTSGVTAIGFTSEMDNGIYNCTVDSGTVLDVLIAVNTAANWLRNNEPDSLNWQPCSFVVTAGSNPPIVSTGLVSLISTTSAHVEGKVVHDGGAPVIASGFCYSTSPNPTIADDTVQTTVNAGIFASQLANLQHNTMYYVKAFATNASGTSYGVQVNFTTLLDGLESWNNPFGLLVFPNPNNGMFTIHLKQQGTFKMDVMDISSRILFSEAVIESGKSMDISSLPAGMYLLRITDTNSMESVYTRLIKK